MPRCLPKLRISRSGPRPPRGKRARRLRFFLLAALAVASPCRADFFNNRNVLPGERAAMMGGAYAAVADDVSGAFYNPAGLALATPGLSLSGNGYAAELNRRTEFFGDESSPPLNLDLNRFNAIPSTAGFNLAYGKRWVFALSVLEADHIRISAIGTADHLPIQVHFGNTSVPYDTSVLRVRIDNQTMLAGPSAGVMLTPALSLGATLYVHYFQGNLGVANDFLNAQGDQALSQTENDVSSVGLAPILGLRWQASEQLSVGASYGAETLHLSGHNSYVTSLVDNHGFSFIDRGTVAGDVRYPHRVTLGVAYEKKGRFLFAADGTYYFALDYPAPHEILRADFADNRHLEVAHADFSVGGEIWVTSHVTFRFGLFSNTSGASQQNAAERVDMFGFVHGFAYYRDGLRMGGGLSVSYGRSRLQDDPTASSRVSWERLHLMCVYGGTSNFLGG